MLVAHADDAAKLSKVSAVAAGAASLSKAGKELLESAAKAGGKAAGEVKSAAKSLAKTGSGFTDLPAAMKELRNRLNETDINRKLALANGDVPSGYRFDKIDPGPPRSGSVNIKVLVPKYSESQINAIIKNLKGAGYKNNPLRLAYEKEVSNLAEKGAELLSQGMSKEEVARILHQARRELGVRYKDATPQPLRDYIYEINQARYGDPLGPSFEYLNEQKTFEQIINSASKPNADIDELLSGFEEWLRS
jgi:hypothetical protein